MLFISHSSGSGGAERSLLTLLKNIDRERYCPLVIGPGSGPLSKSIEQLNIQSFELDIPWWFRSSCSHYVQSIFGHSISSPWTEWSIPITNDLSVRAFNKRIEFLSKIIRDNQIQLVHTNSVTIMDGVLDHAQLAAYLLPPLHSESWYSLKKHLIRPQSHLDVVRVRMGRDYIIGSIH